MVILGVGLGECDIRELFFELICSMTSTASLVKSVRTTDRVQEDLYILYLVSQSAVRTLLTGCARCTRLKLLMFIIVRFLRRLTLSKKCQKEMKSYIFNMFNVYL